MGSAMLRPQNRSLTPRIGALIAALVLLASGCGQHPKLPPLAPDAVLLAFGDSLTYGTGANEDESYPSQLARVTGRRVHGSGRVYHVKYNPPKVPGKDDVTGEDLEQRADDTLEKVNTRLEKYHAETKPLVAYYATWSASGDPLAPRCRKISGLGSVDDITQRALAALA